MGTSTARGATFPVPNRSYPAEREPARSSPIHPIARLSGSERLRRSTAKILLALLYAVTCGYHIATGYRNVSIRVTTRYNLKRHICQNEIKQNLYNVNGTCTYTFWVKSYH